MMKIYLLKFIIIFIAAENPATEIWENFNTLSGWKPLTFAKIKRHTEYSITREDKLSYLKAETDNSASGLLYKKEFNINKTPVIRWRWRVSNIFSKGNGTLKSGDDFPMRVYILFKYNPDNAGITDRIKYNTVKLLYGEYPPHSSISYVWANRNHSASFITSPYTDKSKVIFKQKGKNRVGEWITEQVNVLDDYKRLFGNNPPETAGLAVMSDSDNTGEKGVASIDYIRVSGK